MHETVSLGAGRSNHFTEVFCGTYRPMVDEIGARLSALQAPARGSALREAGAGPSPLL